MKRIENTPNSTVIRDLRDIADPTGNLYESVVIISKRANQLSLELKEELNNKLEQFASEVDNLEEIFENKEQIEISKYYEQQPKSTLMALQEFLEDEIYYRKPEKEA